MDADDELDNMLSFVKTTLSISDITFTPDSKPAQKSTKRKRSQKKGKPTPLLMLSKSPERWTNSPKAAEDTTGTAPRYVTGVWDLFVNGRGFYDSKLLLPLPKPKT